MTGPFDSVLGMKKEAALRRMMLGTPHKYEVATNDARLCALHIRADADTGKAVSMEQIIFPQFG
jgi:hypothetical protein